MARQSEIICTRKCQYPSFLVCQVRAIRAGYLRRAGEQTAKLTALDYALYSSCRIHRAVMNSFSLSYIICSLAFGQLENTQRPRGATLSAI